MNKWELLQRDEIVKLRNHRTVSTVWCRYCENMVDHESYQCKRKDTA